jgi:F1F0 ATPase subunit 2
MMTWQSAPELTAPYMAQMLIAAVTGVLLGLFYYGGLWWTVQQLQTNSRPALLFAASFLVRTAVVVAGFLLVSQGDWLLIVVALVPFILVRMVLTRRWGPKFEA